MSKLTGSQKAWEALKDFWFSIKNIYTLCILPREKEALERKGFDPKCMVCIDRFENETVFVEIRISEPICIGLKDGGGKATSAKHSREDAIQYIKTKLKLMAWEQEVIATRIEALEAKRKNSEEE